MLVLGRKPNETIHIGPDITITILQTRPDRTRIGIEAPPELLILRGELCPPGSLDKTAVSIDVIDTPAAPAH